MVVLIALLWGEKKVNRNKFLTLDLAHDNRFIVSRFQFSFFDLVTFTLKLAREKYSSRHNSNDTYGTRGRRPSRALHLIDQFEGRLSGFHSLNIVVLFRKRKITNFYFNQEKWYSTFSFPRIFFFSFLMSYFGMASKPYGVTGTHIHKVCDGL